MEQHAVPQNISSYQFHLVGDMTLKQFLELAGGVLVGVLFYATGLPAIIKWPLILISAGFGAALAFLPLEERPLEQWILAFFRSVYSPTLFHWEKRDGVKYFSDETAEAGISQIQDKTNNTSTLTSIPFLNKLEASETSYLSKLTGLFNPTPSQPASQVVQPQTQANNTTAGQTVEIKIPISRIQQNASTPQPISEQAFTPQVVQQVQPQVITDKSPVMVSASTIPSNGEVLTMHSLQGAGQAPLTAPTSTPAAGQKEVIIPQTGVVAVEKSQEPLAGPMASSQVFGSQQKVDLTTTQVNPVLISKQINNSQVASFSTDAAPPSLPTIKNTVSGQVMDANGKIIDGAILEIRDDGGHAVRALKTNKAGHFLIVTPLINGRYHIVTEKEGFNFEPIEFEANDNIIEPIAIRAHL